MIDVGQTGHRRRLGGVQVHHSAGLGTRAIKGAMHEHFLRWLIAIDMTERRVEP